jgi:6-pyruvoyltetrahydropterin/6-carboxytetrahydropterin synthase
MSRIRLTRLFTFETAHALQNYKGGCRNIHGHSYRLEVTIIGTPIVSETHPNDGMVMDFKDLKKLVQETIIDPIDHALLLRQDASLELVEALRHLNHKLVLTPFQPTCENMLIDFKQRIRHLLPPYVELHSLKLWETEKSFAEWYATDNL